MQQALDLGEYRPLPLLEIVIEKAPGKTRRLLVPTVNDRIVQTAAARQLSHSLEDEFLDVSYAYRPGRGVDQAIARVLQLRDRGYQFVLDADVTAYFDNVDHALLLGLLRQENLAPALLALIESWLGVPVWDGLALKKLGRGAPQGSPVSPVLANLFLHELDVTISASDQHIVRYADDFLVLCDSVASAQQAREVTAGWLLARGLELHPEKTAIRTFQEGFRFLGIMFAEDEAMVPWKGRTATGRVVRVARPMPASLLNPFLRPRRKPGLLGAELSEAVAGLRLPRKSRGGNVAFLYLTEQGSVLRKSGDRFLVEFDGRILLDLPYHKLEAVLVLGNVQITTQALGELMVNGHPGELPDAPRPISGQCACAGGARCAVAAGADARLRWAGGFRGGAGRDRGQGAERTRGVERVWRCRRDDTWDCRSAGSCHVAGPGRLRGEGLFYGRHAVQQE